MVYWNGAYNCIAVMSCFLFSPIVHSMDGKVKSDKHVIWEKTLIHAYRRFGHQEIYSLVLTSKDSKKAVEDTARGRIKSFFSEQNIPINKCKVWNKYGVACMYDEFNGNIALTCISTAYAHLRLYEPCGVIRTFAMWDKHKFALIRGTDIFFDKGKSLYWYAYDSKRLHRRPVMMYTVDEKSAIKKQLRCVLGFKDKGRTVSRDLSDVAQVPTLLTAILHSTATHEPKVKWQRQDPVRIHYLQGVTIPDGCLEDQHFKLLPATIQEAVTARCAAQKIYSITDSK